MYQNIAEHEVSTTASNLHRAGLSFTMHGDTFVDMCGQWLQGCDYPPVTVLPWAALSFVLR